MNKSYKKRNIVFEWIESIVISVVVIVLMFTFVARTATISGDSMLPTLTDGETIVVYEFFYTPEVGDIIVFRTTDEDDEPYIKRVIATEGQTVDIDFDFGIVYVDGAIVDSSYAYTDTNMRGDVDFPVTVPEGCVFVLGDNRNNSKDSRFSDVGMVSYEQIIGKAVFELFPDLGVI